MVNLSKKCEICANLWNFNDSIYFSACVCVYLLHTLSPSVFEGQPGVSTWANPPTNLVDGMNLFLKNIEITFRRDPNNFRPRINKDQSVKDCEQKNSGQYFFVDKN